MTLVAALIGLATALACVTELDATKMVVTLVFALLAHAGVNVMNDYYDALNDKGAVNTERIFPYTGGVRFIKNGVLGLRETSLIGSALLVLVAIAGMLLAWASAPELLIIGGLGLVIGWNYSAPPFMLNARGPGERCGWAGCSLVAVGADFAQRGQFAAMPLVVTASYSLLLTNIPFVNQFPDRSADEAAAKRTWVVRLGPHGARWGFQSLPDWPTLDYSRTHAGGAPRGFSRRDSDCVTVSACCSVGVASRLPAARPRRLSS